jgi:hypothetical protein
MIDKIDINEDVECVYEFDEIGFSNCMLIKSNSVLYIETSEAIFPFESVANFVIDENSIFLINEDNDILRFTKEQFQIIDDLIKKF